MIGKATRLECPGTCGTCTPKDKVEVSTDVNTGKDSDGTDDTAYDTYKEEIWAGIGKSYM